MQNFSFNYFLCFLIIIIIFLVSSSNFTKKGEYMNMYVHILGMLSWLRAKATDS